MEDGRRGKWYCCGVTKLYYEVDVLSSGSFLRYRMVKGGSGCLWDKGRSFVVVDGVDYY